MRLAPCFFILVIGAASSPAGAQEDLEALKARVAALEKKAQEPGAAPAKQPEWMERYTLEGIAFLRYSRELESSRKDFNEFDIDRVYLSTWAKLWDKGRIRFTLEGGDIREAGTDEFQVTTKHFFLEVKDLFLDGDYLRMGQTDLPWVPFEEGHWGYRFQGGVFADRSGYLTSTDIGLGYGGKIAGTLGSFQVNLANGEGWKKNETGKHKDVHARVTLTPFSEGFLKDFSVSAFLAVGTYEHDTILTGGEPTDRARQILLAGFKVPDRWSFFAEYLRAEDPADKMVSRYPSLAARPNEESKGAGYSVFGTLNLDVLGWLDPETAKSWELIGRLDQLDPDDEINKNGLSRRILGVCRKWNKSLRTLLDWESVQYGDDAGRNNERRVMLQAEIRY